MIACAKCSTTNSLDSTFCRKCGAEMPESEILEAREKLEVLVTDGNHAFNESRTDEALAIAESVLVSDPNSTSALWLKAICHERRGEIPLALECADRIVELNPDSDLDRIRRTQLRNKLNVSLNVVEVPDRRFAMLAAASVVVLVVCVGFFTAYAVQNRSAAPGIVADNSKTNAPSTAETLNQAIDPEAQANPNAETAAGGNPNNTVIGPDDVAPIRSNTGVAPPPSQINRASDNSPSIQLPPALGSGSQLPAVGGSSSALEGSIGPAQPPKVHIEETTPPKSDDPPTTFAVGGDADAKTDPGQIEIKVHNGGPRNTVSGGTSSSANGVEALNRTATQAFQVGNYSQAANLFEQAIRSGGDPVRLNQRLAQSYERLGRNGDAIDCYRRAVQAGEAALAQGKANPAGIRSTIESCQQALKKLGG
jgi:tetratricopeptide (TPR) repeat protein